MANLYKKFGLNPKNAQPGALMMAAHKAHHKHYKHSSKHKTVSVHFGKGKYEEGEEVKAINALHEMHQGKHKSTSMMCKKHGVAHTAAHHKSHHKGQAHPKHLMHKRHHKALKLNPPSKGHAPKGAHGRAAVHALGRTKTTGNFARIEASKGRGAAINAYQNALRAHKSGK